MELFWCFQKTEAGGVQSPFLTHPGEDPTENWGLLTLGQLVFLICPNHGQSRRKCSFFCSVSPQEGSTWLNDFSMRMLSDEMISAWWPLPICSSRDAPRCPSPSYVGLWKYTSVNHPGHHNSCYSAFFYYPLGTFQMDVPPSFIQFLKCWSLWVKPHEDACSTSFTSKLTKKKKKADLASSLHL